MQNFYIDADNNNFEVKDTSNILSKSSLVEAFGKIFPKAFIIVRGENMTRKYRRMSTETHKCRFEDTYYEKGGFQKFDDMIAEKNSLSSIAKHFGFTRQYASLCFQNIYGMKYEEYLKKCK